MSEKQRAHEASHAQCVVWTQKLDWVFLLFCICLWMTEQSRNLCHVFLIIEHCLWSYSHLVSILLADRKIDSFSLSLLFHMTYYQDLLGAKMFFSFFTFLRHIRRRHSSFFCACTVHSCVCMMMVDDFRTFRNREIRSEDWWRIAMHLGTRRFEMIWRGL